ncbi:tyrosine--tRNA ligase [Gracilaria domingensis]|nr:tyrosine--tRNA ligase [Gracilaria domingensis]
MERHEGEAFQERNDVLLVLRKPHGAALTLSKLLAIGGGEQREGNAVQRLGADLSGQFGARGYVSPLIGAPQLHDAVQGVTQVHKVVRLQQLVGELGEADAVVAGQARLDRVLGNHGVDARVLAHVAKKVQKGHAPQPVVVVGDDERAGGQALAHELRLGALQHLAQVGLDAGQVALDCVRRQHGALGALAAGVAHGGGGAAQQRDHAVAAALEPRQRQNGQQVAQVQRVGPGAAPPAPPCTRPAARGAAARR